MSLQIESIRKNRMPVFWAVLVLLLTARLADAQENPFSGGWVLDAESSSLNFGTVKNTSKHETHSFAQIDGEVDTQGNAKLRVQLDSVDTKADLRDVRLRFLLFETYKFPEATVSLQVDPALVQNLDNLGSIDIPLEFELDLHGIKRKMTVEAVVTAMAGNQASVSSVKPITIETNLFGLDEGIKKIEQSAKVSIVRMAFVSFNLVFDRQATGGANQISTANTATIPETSAVVATSVTEPTVLETQDEFSLQECVDRFEVLSQTGAIQFKVASAGLNPESKNVLTTIIDVVKRCPRLKIVVSGHTDSIGNNRDNQVLSEKRASSVQQYLVDHNIDPARIRAMGYGESRPLANNDTAANRLRNRRIEFAVDVDDV